MTVARRRFLICLTLALAAHAALFAAIGDHSLLPDDDSGHMLSVTFSARATAADVATPVLAVHAQHGPDDQSRRARMAAAATMEHGSAATDTAIARIQRPAPDPRRRPAATARPQHERSGRQSAQPPRARSARADPRAAYLAAWRRRVEHYGNRHYPTALIATTAHHRLTLGVTVNAGGHLRSVRILNSSGSEELDRAALAIVRNAAPYPSFPAALRAHNRRLTFAYDWLFGHPAHD